MNLALHAVSGKVSNQPLLSKSKKYSPEHLLLWFWQYIQICYDPKKRNFFSSSAFQENSRGAHFEPTVGVEVTLPVSFWQGPRVRHRRKWKLKWLRNQWSESSRYPTCKSYCICIGLHYWAQIASQPCSVRKHQFPLGPWCWCQHQAII